VVAQRDANAAGLAAVIEVAIAAIRIGARAPVGAQAVRLLDAGIADAQGPADAKVVAPLIPAIVGADDFNRDARHRDFQVAEGQGEIAELKVALGDHRADLRKGGPASQVGRDYLNLI